MLLEYGIQAVPQNVSQCSYSVAGEADSVGSVFALACHIGGPNSVNPGQILLFYGKYICSKIAQFVHAAGFQIRPIFDKVNFWFCQTLEFFP